MNATLILDFLGGPKPQENLLAIIRTGLSPRAVTALAERAGVARTAILQKLDIPESARAAETYTATIRPAGARRLHLPIRDRSAGQRRESAAMDATPDSRLEFHEAFRPARHGRRRAPNRNRPQPS